MIDDRNIKESKRGVEVQFSTEVYERYQRAARSADLSLPAWLKMAAASYYGNWVDPTRKRELKKATKPNDNWAIDEDKWMEEHFGPDRSKWPLND